MPQDHAEAVRWFRLAADQELTVAQYNLGIAHGAGRGVQQDFVSAYMWLHLAVSRSSGRERDVSLKARALAMESMTSEQIAEAERLAREWKPADPR